MQSKCIKCPKPAKISLRHIKQVCPSCFSEIIEKRVRKAIRENKWIKRNDTVFVVDNGSLAFSVTKYLLESISKDLPMEIQTVKAPREGKVVLPWSLDDEIEGHLKDLFGEERRQAKHIRLLKNVSDEEIQVFAEVKKLAGSLPEKSELGRKLSDLEEKYPGSKFGLLKSFQELD